MDKVDRVDEKKTKRKIAALMWSIRMPEDRCKVKRSTNPRVDYLRHLVQGGFDNAMCHNVMGQMAETMEFEAPDKIWVNNTAWRLRKEIKDANKDKSPDVNTHSTRSVETNVKDDVKA